MDSSDKEYSLFPLDELKYKNKSKSEILDMKRVYSIYNTCSIKTIIELKNKLEDKYNYVEMGISVLYYIFFLVLRTSKSMKLCLKLSERAILLFTEFIIQSKEKKASGDLVFNPSIGDAVSFAYKKTIGSVSLNSIEKDNDYEYDETMDLKWIMKACETMNRIYLSFSVDNDISYDLLQSIKIDIYTDIYYLYEELKDSKETIQSNINLLLEQDIKLFNKWIMLKCYIIVLSENINIKVSKFIEKIKELQNPNIEIDFKYAIDFQKSFYWQKIKKIMDSR